MKGLYDPYGELHRLRLRRARQARTALIVGGICVVVCIVTTGLAILNSIHR